MAKIFQISNKLHLYPTLNKTYQQITHLEQLESESLGQKQKTNQ